MLDEDDDPFDGDADDPAAGYREPDPEPEPEADLPDPESELPSVPSVDVPEPPAPDEAPDELLRGFWSTVLLLNATLLVATFGVLMLVFDVERPLGALLVVLAALLARRSYRRYRVLDERHRAGELTAGNGDEDDDGAPAAEGGDSGDEPPAAEGGDADDDAPAAERDDAEDHAETPPTDDERNR